MKNTSGLKIAYFNQSIRQFHRDAVFYLYTKKYDI